ncbi:glycosyltransferase [Kocuria sp. LUK]|uniref:glycosyltransferase n=1 Tax=Kocuria sp. LUK TaxID=2897828 RepID=UPI001E47450E|nr:glycosyltransferase [Kocuria sp. LUK]MCD1143942.1 glycosyltransferase [Kocuria sp. LUK]
MRIAMVSEHASPLAALGGVDAGGQNVYVAALAEGLARRGHDVSVYTRRDDPALPEVVEQAPGVRVVHVPAGPAGPLPKDELAPYMDEFGRWLARDWARTGAPDLVHAHFWMSGLAARRAAEAHRIPVVQTFHALGAVKRRHQGAADTSPAGRLAAEHGLITGADLVLATCRDERAELLALGGDPSRIDVVPCGVDLGAFAPAPPRPAGARKRILALGRLVERKGVDVAVRALAELPGAELVVAGGPDRAELDRDPEALRLRALARELGVADRVELLGRVDHRDTAELLAGADVVACLPWYEPFGMVPLEAMACARPVVGSAVGGLLDSVEDGVTGLLVPPRDPAGAATALRALLEDPQRAARMGRAGRERVERRFGWGRVAEQTERSYERALGRHRREHPPLRERTEAWLGAHLDELAVAARDAAQHAGTVDRWGARLAGLLGAGGRVLAAGNGGSAAEAQHFTAELVGRFVEERRALAAVCLSAETSSLTAIVNDYGAEELFARQVAAHGRPGDVLVLLSTSGRSPNVLAAAERAREHGLTVWALTGPGPNPLTELADEALTVAAPSTSVIQEVHLMLLHAVCAAVDARLVPPAPAPEEQEAPAPRTALRAGVA